MEPEPKYQIPADIRAAGYWNVRPDRKLLARIMTSDTDIQILELTTGTAAGPAHIAWGRVMAAHWHPFLSHKFRAFKNAGGFEKWQSYAASAFLRALEDSVELGNIKLSDKHIASGRPFDSGECFHSFVNALDVIKSINDADVELFNQCAGRLNLEDARAAAASYLIGEGPLIGGAKGNNRS